MNPPDSLTNHLEKLRYLVTIGETGSLLKAANLLEISQPSLSKSMNVLEDAIGARLLERTSRGTTLSSSGKSLFEFGKRFLSEAETLGYSLKNSIDTQRQEVKIGTKEPLAIYLWPGYLQNIRISSPQLDISLKIERSSQKLITDLISGRLDLIYLPEPIYNEKYRTYSICKEGFGVYGSSNLKLNNETPFYIFLNSISGKGDSVKKNLKKLNFKMTNVKEVDSFIVAKSLAESGLGISLLPKNMAIKNPQLKNVHIEGFNPKKLGVLNLCLCIANSNLENKNLKKVLTELKKYHLS